MDIIFQMVKLSLDMISDLTGFSYKAINIIVYYIFLPFIYFTLIDKIQKRHYFKIGFTILVLVLLLLIGNFEAFSEKIFDWSVDFLNWFNFIGIGYIEASVIICVLFPFAIFTVLVYYAFRSKTGIQCKND